MDTVFCPICGKEYKDVNMHIRKGHGLDPEEVVEEAFGTKLTPKERQRGTAQKRRTVEMMDSLNRKAEDLRKTQEGRLEEMRNTWRKRQSDYDHVMNERITEIIKK